MIVYHHHDNAQVTIARAEYSEIERVDFALCAQPKQTLEAYCKGLERKPDIICNGGFFNMAGGETVMNYSDEGEIISSSDAGRVGIGIRGDNTMIYGDVDTVRPTCRDFISGYPPLVAKGKAVPITTASEIDYKARRTALGFNGDAVFIVAVDGGMRLAALQKVMLDIGSHYAINLDGGGSTRLIVGGEVLTEQAYSRPVDNVVCVYLKKDEGEHKVKAVCAKKTGTLDISGNAEKGRYISKGDKVEFGPMLDNLLLPVTYPVKNGTRTAYLRSTENFTQA